MQETSPQAEPRSTAHSGYKKPASRSQGKHIYKKGRKRLTTQIGQRLKHLRRTKNGRYSMRPVARYLGLSAEQIFRYEDGSHAIPLYRLEQLAQYWQLSFIELLTGYSEQIERTQAQEDYALNYLLTTYFFQELLICVQSFVNNYATILMPKATRDDIDSFSYMEKLAERVKKMRLSRNYKPKEVAPALDIKTDHYLLLESGRRRLNLWHLDRLATFYQVSPAVFFSDEIFTVTETRLALEEDRQQILNAVQALLKQLNHLVEKHKDDRNQCKNG